MHIRIWLLFLVGWCWAQERAFKDDQRRYPRYRSALAEKEEGLVDLYKRQGLSYPPREILLVAYKREAVLEVWARNKRTEKLRLVKSYPICELSGDLGPKREQGDLQIPEGYYYVDRFNPASSFWLSLGINYPNRSDRILGTKNNLGGDIFIHGACVTIGCIPITDHLIKEVYVMAVDARQLGQKRIPVYIFPARLDEDGLEYLHSVKANLMPFWSNLAEGYRWFTQHHDLISFTVTAEGRYCVLP